ncbi:unnamed protein product [Ranitomeya imitator]|uniref:Uncharacterized protein n=1 Tax=Ranitomeya imitator TaxID=111125 RepID=A0ABN9L5K8_9NEOB|nr:unnamed protein product [Ranitomeya imitator]
MAAVMKHRVGSSFCESTWFPPF